MTHYIERENSLANIITILRFPLMIILGFLLYLGSPTVVLWCVPFLLIIILMDTLDGNLARRRGETSLLGSALDIAADRTLEFILWVLFANLGLISITIPIIVIVRGVTVDAVRAVGIGNGIPPFKQVTNPVSRFLVSSPVMRSSYSIAKTIAFNLLVVDLAFTRMNHPSESWIHVLALIFSWIAVALCCARGIPALIDGSIMLNSTDKAKLNISNQQTMD